MAVVGDADGDDAAARHHWPAVRDALRPATTGPAGGDGRPGARPRRTGPGRAALALALGPRPDQRPGPERGQPAGDLVAAAVDDVDHVADRLGAAVERGALLLAELHLEDLDE